MVSDIKSKFEWNLLKTGVVNIRILKIVAKINRESMYCLLIFASRYEKGIPRKNRELIANKKPENC
jgi:hypothetical protein